MKAKLLVPVVLLAGILTLTLLKSFSFRDAGPELRGAEEVGTANPPARRELNSVAVREEQPYSFTPSGAAVTRKNGDSVSGIGRRSSDGVADYPALDVPRLTAEQLGLQVGNRPRETMLQLEERISRDIEQRSQDAELPVALVRHIERIVEGSMVDPAIAHAIRGLRCSETLCEVLIDKEMVADLAVTISVLSREIRAADDDYVMTLNAANPNDPRLWSWYLIRRDFFE